MSLTVTSVTQDPATQDLIVHLQECLAMARERSHHCEASQAFNQLHSNLATSHPIAAEVLRLMWNELLSTHRSADFLEQLSNIERQFNEQMTESHVQLQQNYLRLLEEQ
ncbi:hypothetical protein C7B76_11115 [filamentous cyanobacterium CCP2]|nr:hypothetical protein C7B76_11115 [filamentous cyanobacterium CCP2]